MDGQISTQKKERIHTHQSQLQKGHVFTQNIHCSLWTGTTSARRLTPSHIQPSEPYFLYVNALHCLELWRARQHGRQCCIRPAAPRGYEALVDILANDVSIAVWRQIGLSQFVATRRTPPRQCGGGSCCSSLCSNKLELRGQHILFIRLKEIVQSTKLQIGCRSLKSCEL